MTIPLHYDNLKLKIYAFFFHKIKIFPATSFLDPTYTGSLKILY